MKTFFFHAAVLIVCMRVGRAAEALQQNRQLSDDEEAAERYLFSGALSLGNTGNVGTITIGNAAYIALGAALLVPLIIGLALLFYLFGGPRDSGSSSYGSSGYGSSSYARDLHQ